MSAAQVCPQGGQRKVRSDAPTVPRGLRTAGGVKASGGNSALVVKLSSLALVTCKQLPQGGKEEKGVAKRDSETSPETERSEETSQPV